MAKKKKQADAPAGSPAWMATFSDLMTQLLCFFVFLTASASFDLEKANVAMSSFNKAFGEWSGKIDVIRDVMNIRPAYRETAQIPGWESAFSRSFEWRNIEKTYHDITAYIEASKKGEDVKLNLELDKVIISITDNLMFEPGSAILKRQSFPILYEVGLALRKIDNPLLIEGHTDPTPIKSDLFPSNWELSLGRAMAVSNFLMKKVKIEESRLRVAGRAHYKPVTSNVTAEGRKQNRRVDIIILAKGNPDG